jgi:class 3 adenylate cyclase/tetratricopeptide (TPR) repeat protein
VPPRNAATAGDLSAYFPRFALTWARETRDEAWREIDASLVFVDISGFTALSERLARRGHQGAEELTQTLSTCFADLLVAAYSDGGSLVKFGGDALFLLFDGDDHAHRAVRSALQMRGRLARSGRISTSVGAIGLRMSVGVHSGPVHLFRVGRSHKELIVAGPGPSTVALMEQTATAGQIVVSRATAERVAPRLIGDPAGEGFLLRGRPAVSSDVSFPDTVGVVDGDVSDAVPLALRSCLGSSVEPEHRQVTVAFIRFDGIDGIIENDGVAAAAAAIDELVGDVQTAVDDEGVTFLATDADRDGGKIIVVGGAPSALDDTEGRVLRAMRRVVEGDRRLPVRVGVHQGHAFVGEVGPAYRRTYTVMGDTVNLAARLMASASAGELRSTAGVLDLAASEFETTELEPFYVKGKSRPVDAFLVGPRRRRRTRAVTDLPFVGRRDELWSLAAALDAMRSGSGGLVDIAGEAGVGKSRLLREFLAESAEVPVVTAYCETYEAKTPYFAARFLLRGALGIRATSAAAPETLRSIVTEAAPELLPWLPLIGAVVDIAVPPTPETELLETQFLRDQTTRVIVDLLDAVVRGQQVFVVEDAQWVDDLSAELLVAIARHARGRRWLVCVVRRLDRGGYHPGDEATTRVVVDPLDDEDAHTLLQSALGEDYWLRPDQLEALVDRAGGNPLFVEQLAFAMVAGAGEASLSGSLESIVAAQIDTLPAADRQALRFAAVLGPMFETERLVELVAAEGGDGRGAPRRLRKFIEPTAAGWFRFRNQCYREVAYETLSFRKRKELHARAGDAIEAAANASEVDRSEMLSFHFLHAQEYDKCWTYARAAAERATAKYANVEATALYERALIAGGQLGAARAAEIADTWRALGKAALDGGLYEKAKLAFGKARALLGDDFLSVATLCELESLTEMYRGRTNAAVRWVNRGLRLLEGHEDKASLRVRAELRQLRGTQLQRARKNREALRWAQLAIADAQRSRHERALARAYSVTDVALLDLGRIDEAKHLTKALDIWTRLGEVKEQATVLTILGAIAYSKGEWDEALDYFVRGRDACIKAGDLVTAGYGTTNVAEILLDQGRGDEVSGLQDVIHLWRAVGHPGPVSGALTNLGRGALQRGDVLKARDLFDQARWAAEDLGADTVEFDVWIADCMIREGEPGEALTLLDHAIRAEKARGATTFLGALLRAHGYARAAIGDAEGAAADFASALEVARTRSVPFEIALALDAQVWLDHRRGAEPDTSAAAERDEIFERLGVRAVFAPKVG